ncbi:MAG: chloride channel protein [Planctomycetota bacterium]|nr:chloride channel protein [Planctomycetota bacterium]
MVAGRRAKEVHSPTVFLFAAAVGVVGGLVGVAYQLARKGVQITLMEKGGFLDAALALPWWKALLIPVAGATVSSILFYGLLRGRTQGMADVMEAVTLRNAKLLSIRRTLARALASLALITTGGSVGREGPIVYVSASLGRRLGGLSRSPLPRLGLFAGCGVAAGMSAAYGAPFGAALFAMEVVLGSFAVDILAPVVVASVTAMLVVKGFAEGPLDGVIQAHLYTLPTGLELTSAWEILLYLGLGMLAAVVAMVFLRSLTVGERLFRRLAIPRPLQLPLGGLIIGLISIKLPYVWGGGHDTLGWMFTEWPVWEFLLLLLVVKIFATAVTVGSGGSGGLFSPNLLVGGLVGALVGDAARAMLPDLVVEPRAYAVVGMAAGLAGATQAPIMAIFFLFEMTKQPDLLLPLTVSTVAASVTARSLGLDSMYVQPLLRKGVHIPETIEETALTTTHVADLMRPDAVWVSETASFDVVVGMLRKTRKGSIYVVTGEGALRGAIHLHDLKNYLGEDTLSAAIIAADLAVPVPRVTGEKTLAEILDIFDDPDLNEIPVVDDNDQLLGVVDRRDVIAALSVEVLHRGTLRAKFVMPEGDTHYVEIPPGHQLARVPVPEAFVGKTLGSTDFRRLTGLNVLTIVRRGNGREKRILPAPELVLEAGDDLVLLGPAEAIHEYEQRRSE